MSKVNLLFLICLVFLSFIQGTKIKGNDSRCMRLLLSSKQYYNLLLDKVSSSSCCQDLETLASDGSTKERLFAENILKVC